MTAQESYSSGARRIADAKLDIISAAARAAGIERMSIYKMIRRLGLDKSEAPADSDDSDESTDHGRRRPHAPSAPT